MKIPLLDLNAQLDRIRPEVKAAVDEVLESTRYIMGPKVTELEKAVAAYCNAKYGVGVSSGTDALLIALMALDIKAGDEVITTTYSFFATAGSMQKHRQVVSVSHYREKFILGFFIGEMVALFGMEPDL